MLSYEPGSISHSKLVRLDVVRCPRLNRQGVIDSRSKENGTLVVSHRLPGGRRMTLIVLSIKISKTAPAKTSTFHTDWKKSKNEDLT